MRSMNFGAMALEQSQIRPLHAAAGQHGHAKASSDLEASFAKVKESQPS